MSKRKSKSKSKNAQNLNNRNMLLMGGVALAVIAVVVVALVMGNNGGDSSAEDAAATASGPVALVPGLISPAQYQAGFSNTSNAPEYVLIDVRTPEEFNSGHIAGAVNIPVDQIGQRLSEIPTDQSVVLYCRSGNRSATAASILRSAGYSDVYDIDGGIIAWTGARLPLE